MKTRSSYGPGEAGKAERARYYPIKSRAVKARPRSTERARLNVLQALQDLNAVSEKTAADAKDVDAIVGSLSRYAITNHKIIQSLLRDSLVVVYFPTPMRIWLTPQGSNYLRNED